MSDFARGLCVGCRASDKCQKEKRKTINGDDLLWAMATLGFEEYVEPLKIYLHKYRDVCNHRPSSLLLAYINVNNPFVLYITPSHVASLSSLQISGWGVVITDGGM